MVPYAPIIEFLIVCFDSGKRPSKLEEVFYREKMCLQGFTLFVLFFQQPQIVGAC